MKGTLSFSNSMAHASVVLNVESIPSLNYDVHLKITDNKIRVLNLNISDPPTGRSRVFETNFDLIYYKNC